MRVKVEITVYDVAAYSEQAKVRSSVERAIPDPDKMRREVATAIDDATAEAERQMRELKRMESTTGESE